MTHVRSATGFLSVLFFAAAFSAQTQTQGAGAASSGPANLDSVKPGIPDSEVALLRPAVLPSLRKHVGIVNDEENPEAAEMESEFRKCMFTPFKLGVLGPAVLVVWNPLNNANAEMRNIYLRKNGAYHLLIEAEGFGPEILPEPRPVPDLVFGWGEGVCHATYSRYRYQNGHYKTDACDQETEGKDADCTITSCANKLPTFPNPFPD